MNDLKDRLIRLGSENPKLRKHIRPVLDRISGNSSRREMKDAIMEYWRKPGVAKDLLRMNDGNSMSDVSADSIMNSLMDMISPDEAIQDFNSLSRDDRLDILEDLGFAKGKRF
jgi:hypothetical protein